MVDLKRLRDFLSRTASSLQKLQEKPPTPDTLTELNRLTDLAERAGTVAEKATRSPFPPMPTGFSPLAGPRRGIPFRMPPQPPAAQQATPTASAGPTGVPGALQEAPPQPVVPQAIAQQDPIDRKAELLRSGLSQALGPETVRGLSYNELIERARAASPVSVPFMTTLPVSESVKQIAEDLDTDLKARAAEAARPKEVGAEAPLVMFPETEAALIEGATKEAELRRTPVVTLDTPEQAKQEASNLGLTPEQLASELTRFQATIPSEEGLFLARVQRELGAKPQLFTLENLITALFFGAPTALQNYFAEKRAFQGGQARIGSELFRERGIQTRFGAQERRFQQRQELSELRTALEFATAQRRSQAEPILREIIGLEKRRSDLMRNILDPDQSAAVDQQFSDRIEPLIGQLRALQITPETLRRGPESK